MRFALVAIIGIAYLTVAAQVSNPPAGHVFGESSVPRVYVIIHPDSLAALYHPDNWFENHNYPVTFVFESDGSFDTLHNVGIRFRGNTSRTKIKKSFRLSFNHFEPGRRYHGLKNINLNAEVNDPSMLRSYTTWSLFRKYGVAGSRANHAMLYINGEYYGLYQNTENINDEFAGLRFGDSRGNLYKCTFPANLHYISDNPDDYKMAPWGTRTYELTTNEAADDYTDLSRFIKFLNQSTQNELRCRFWEKFDVYTYLKNAAIEVLSGHWDGYIHNQNNFYLYRNPRSDRFEYIPYDLDNTWGIDWLGQDWADMHVYNWNPSGDWRPLYNRLMQIGAYRDVFTWHLRKIAAQELQNTTFHESLEQKQTQLSPFALADPYRPLDFGWSEADYADAISAAAGGHVQYGVVPYALERAQSALQQTLPVSIAPIFVSFRENFGAMPIVLSITVNLDGPAWTSLELQYAINGVQQPSITATGGGAAHTFHISMMPGLEVLSYNITATGTEGLTRAAFCSDRKVYYGGGEGVLLNEVMSSNSNTIADPFGEYDDWVELHHSGTESVSLDGYFLTDKAASPRYWHMPGVVMNPGSFRLVWADDQIWQGPMHASFKISASGEGVYLFKEEPDGIRLVDMVQVPAIATNKSWGRVADAALPWVLFDNPTPGASNGTLSAADQLRQDILPYPNPVSERLYWKLLAHYQIFDAQGRLITVGYGTSVDVGSLAKGLYVVHLNGDCFKFAKD